MSTFLWPRGLDIPPNGLYDRAVQAWILLRWAPRLLRTQPTAWAALAVCSLLWLSIRTLSIYGITTNGSVSEAYLYDVAFVSSALGAALACAWLGRYAWLASQLSSPSRILAELLMLWVVGLFFQAASLALPAWLSQAPPWSLLPQALLTSLHWGALALVLLRTPISVPLRPVALWALGWWLPALLEGSGWIASRAHWLLDTARYLEQRPIGVETLGATLADTGPAGTLIVIALLLRSPSER